MATATRPESAGKFEIETGDDFVLTQQTLLTGAAFTGLIPLGASTSDIKNVVVEVYRVFPFRCRAHQRATNIFNANQHVARQRLADFLNRSGER
jgi:hypothetical protein